MWTHRHRTCKRSPSRRSISIALLVFLIGFCADLAVSLSYSSFGPLVREDLFPAVSLKSGANSETPATTTTAAAAAALDKSDDIVATAITQSNGSVTRGYWCDYCSVGFNKRKSYEEHLRGKRHNAVITEGDLVWKEYLESGGASSSRSNGGDGEDDDASSPPRFAFYDESVTKMDVSRAWSLDLFTEGLRARTRSSKKKPVVGGMVGTMESPGGAGRWQSSSSSSMPSQQQPPKHTGNNGNAGGGNQIDPTLRLSDLPPPKRAALFRYLHVTTSGIDGLTDMVAALPQKYVRVKELLESLEVYFQFRENILRRSSKKGQKAKRLGRVYDIGCGHGLVGMLIAASCPNIEVRSIDLVPRESFLAQREAFESTGTALPNLAFETGDLSTIRELSNLAGDDDDDEKRDQTTGGPGHSLVLCVHGCKELTHESIELAKEKDWAWLALPCCLQAGDHLGGGTSLKLKSDHTRYAMLCGAIAANYQPETVTTIDSRITGRGIVLASSGGG